MSTIVHPQSIVEKGAELDEGVKIGPFCWVGSKVKIAAGTTLYSHVRIEGSTTIGRDNQIESQVCLGGAPQDLSYKGEDTRLEIGDGNVFKECFTAHRASTKEEGVTRIGSHNFFMTYTHVAHDCRIGNHIIAANYAGFPGHVQVFDYANISGLTAVIQHGRVGRYAFMAGGCLMRRDLVPFMAAKGDGDITGPNLVGLKRAGFDSKQLRVCKELYKIFFNKKMTAQKAIEEIKVKYPEDLIAKEFVDFVEASKIGVKR
ncbi:acyl-ACP--UDP-N-acetylglucosamine O-acyltransferase [bacterium]|nr:acyl-ACP--UDP-N-acetylglucosamine O-acyltransferase [bacterium]